MARKAQKVARPAVFLTKSDASIAIEWLFLIIEGRPTRKFVSY